MHLCLCSIWKIYLFKGNKNTIYICVRFFFGWMKNKQNREELESMYVLRLNDAIRNIIFQWILCSYCFIHLFFALHRISKQSCNGMHTKCVSVGFVFINWMAMRCVQRPFKYTTIQIWYERGPKCISTKCVNTEMCVKQNKEIEVEVKIVEKW